MRSFHTPATFLYVFDLGTTCTTAFDNLVGGSYVDPASHFDLAIRVLWAPTWMRFIIQRHPIIYGFAILIPESCQRNWS